MYYENVIITGTSSGLGFELVKKFNAENYNISSRSPCLIKSNQLSTLILILQIQNLFRTSKLIQSKYKTIDILINNADAYK